MSSVDQQRFNALAGSFQNAGIFNFQPSAVPLDNPSNSTEEPEIDEDTNEIIPQEITEETEEEGTSLSTLLAEIQAYLDENNLNDQIAANRTEEGVVLVLQESILFPSAEAGILEEGVPFLDRVATMLGEISNEVRIEGHTDSRSISNYRYPSNWELSTARASSVVRYFAQEHNLERDRFMAVGYADTEPLVPNNSPENWSQNRRVEIVIQEHDADIENEGASQS